MSTSSSTSTSKGCGRPCSSGSTPCTPSSRRPAITILSIATTYPSGASAVRSSLGFLATTRPDLLRGGRLGFRALRALALRPLRLGGLRLRLRRRLLRRRQRLGRRPRVPEQPLVHRGGDDLPAHRPDLPAGQPLEDDDRVRSLLHETGIEEKAGDDTEQAVAELRVVHQDPLRRAVEPTRQRRVHVAQTFGELVVPPQRHVLVREPHLLVRVQVVGRVEQRQHVREPVPGQPQQLLLPAHLAMVAGEAAGPLGHREPPRDHPREVAGFEALGPSPPHAAPASATSSAWRSRTACAAARTSCTRTIDAPRPTAHTTVANVPSSRWSAGSGSGTSPVRASKIPMNVLREVPTRTGTCTRSTRLGSPASSRRLWSTVLPKPIPGSAASAPGAMPAARAASTRAARKSPTSATTSS